MRAATRYQRAGLTIPIMGIIYAAIKAFESWSNGDRQELLFLGIVIVIGALFAWHHYAFGQLVARYEAELRDIKGPHAQS